MVQLKASQKNILFVHYGEEWIRGSERCLLDLITHLDRSLFNPVVWCNSKVLAAEVKKLGIQVVKSQFTLLLGWKKPRYDFKAFFQLYRQGIDLVKTHKIDLIHANSGAPNQWLNLVARSCRRPLISHLHSRNQLRDRITLGLHQVTHSIGVSQTVIDQLIKDGVDKSKVKVIPNGIDTRRLLNQTKVNIRQQLNINDDDYLMATTASLIHRKGVDLLIEATSLLIEKGISAHLLVIGEGDERDNLEALAYLYNIQPFVHLIGERSDVAGILRGGVDLFVSGAREEVFGLVLAEAGLARLAVVAPKVGGIPSVIVDGVTGKLVEPNNAFCLANTITQLFKDPKLAEHMAEKAYEHVMQHFTIEQNVRCFEKTYQSFLKQPESQFGWLNHWSFISVFMKTSEQLFSLLFRKLGRGIAQ